MIIRIVLCLLITALLPTVYFVEAQQFIKVPRIGALLTGPSHTAAPYVDAFRAGLRELGHNEGRNIAVEYRWAEGGAERFAELAADLVRARVDLLFAWGSTATAAAKRSTSTIPIVFVGVGDPVGRDLSPALRDQAAM